VQTSGVDLYSSSSISPRVLWYGAQPSRHLDDFSCPSEAKQSRTLRLRLSAPETSNQGIRRASRCLKRASLAFMLLSVPLMRLVGRLRDMSYLVFNNGSRSRFLGK